MPKTSQIKISDDLKRTLRKLKRGGETFEAVVRREMAKGKKKKTKSKKGKKK